ncbi:MAG: PadR family transcriptional regulator [Burkholderiaceae bacterium]|nr:PadR family transcriptional regulator [Burkholderiaceae bacterium]
MSVRHSLLALLADEPRHGYGLKSLFEASTAATWPLNVGQVYTTLARLERDGLVATTSIASDDERRTWCITAAGREALTAWFAEPVAHTPPPRDELAIKVLLAIAADAGVVTPLLERQRAAAMQRLQELTRHLAKADPNKDLPWVLVIEALRLDVEAQVRWIDLVAQHLRERGVD